MSTVKGPLIRLILTVELVVLQNVIPTHAARSGFQGGYGESMNIVNFYNCSSGAHRNPHEERWLFICDSSVQCVHEHTGINAITNSQLAPDLEYGSPQNIHSENCKKCKYRFSKGLPGFLRRPLYSHVFAHMLLGQFTPTNLT